MLRKCIRTGNEEWHVLEGFLRESTSNWISKDMSGFPGLKGNSEEHCRSMVAWEEAAPSLPQCGLFGEKMSTWVKLLLQEALWGSHTEARQWAHFLALLPTSFSPAAQAASSFLAFLACSLLQGAFELKFSLQSHTSGSSIFVRSRKTMHTRRSTAILGISSEIPGSCIASQVELFLDMFWGTWKSIQMMVQTALNTDFWVAADFYSSDCQDLSRNTQGWAVCVPWFYASTYPSVKFCVNDGRVAEHESRLTPTPQIMKWIPKKNDFSKVTERNHGLLGHLSSHPSIYPSIHQFISPSSSSTHPSINSPTRSSIYSYAPIYPPIYPPTHSIHPPTIPFTHPPFHSFLSTQPCCVFPVPGLV